MQQLSFQVAQYEGPLDLILQLIAKHKLNIWDIEITKLLEQYLAAVDEMVSQDLEVATSFLEMASRLVHMKTVSLLPKHEEQTEELKNQLTGELLEYMACKEAAGLLRAQMVGENLFVRLPMPVDYDPTYTLSHHPQELLRAYIDATGKGKRRLPPEPKVFDEIVAHKVVSVPSRVVHILKRLYKENKVRFGTLFGDGGERSELVATFLAVLELMKAKRIYMADGTDEIILCAQKDKAKEETES